MQSIEGANRDREWLQCDLNTLIAAAGPDITARARFLVRNNGYVVLQRLYITPFANRLPNLTFEVET
jgi:hypothetical protein